MPEQSQLQSSQFLRRGPGSRLAADAGLREHDGLNMLPVLCASSGSYRCNVAAAASEKVVSASVVWPA